MVKITPQERKLRGINSSLRDMTFNNDVKKIRIYLKSLLVKCIEALAENDFQKYNLAESVLNETIVRIGSSVDNFEEFYSNLKSEVAVESLQSLLGVDSISVLSSNNPVEAIIITSEKAKEIRKTWDYVHYSVSKQQLYNYWDIESNYRSFENEAYTVLYNKFFIIIILKEDVSGAYLDTNFTYKLGLDSELDVLEGFVTKNPDLTTPLTITERIVLAENEIDYTADNDFNYISDSLEKGQIYYYNETEAFLVLINDSFYKIFNKKAGKSINFYLQHYQINLKKNVRFLAKFSDYCLGQEGILKEDLIQNEEENVPVNKDGS